jgi:hypothetical protein
MNGFIVEPFTLACHYVPMNNPAFKAVIPETWLREIPMLPARFFSGVGHPKVSPRELEAEEKRKPN